MIKAWYEHYDGNVYISFSGGKDSTALLTLAREVYPDIPGVFVDTGLEYPELKSFVKKFDNIITLRPKMTFKQVCETFGYPIFGKEIAQCVQGARQYVANDDGNEDRPHLHDYQLIMGKIDKYGNVKEVIPPEDKSLYTKENYKFMLDADFEISSKCCDVMKKAPVHTFNHQNNIYPILGTMASESKLRTYQWIKNGCNAFDGRNPSSKPFSFWTEQDVLMYLYVNNIEIASVYGDIVPDREIDDGLFVRMQNLESFELDRPAFDLSGLSRTGCMFCLFGIQSEPCPNRLQKMKETHPKQYEYLMKPVSEGGFGYKEKIDWINEHGNMKIGY